MAVAVRAAIHAGRAAWLPRLLTGVASLGPFAGQDSSWLAVLRLIMKTLAGSTVIV
jgi:hypothetical protein